MPASEPRKKSESRLVAMRELDLTTEDAELLKELIDQPRAFPKRPPEDLPAGDPSILRQPAH